MFTFKLVLIWDHLHLTHIACHRQQMPESQTNCLVFKLRMLSLARVGMVSEVRLKNEKQLSPCPSSILRIDSKQVFSLHCVLWVNGAEVNQNLIVGALQRQKTHT